MNQREAVYSATHSVLSDAGVHFEDFGQISDVMTKELRDKVHAIVCESFRQGEVSFKDTASNREKMSSDSKLNTYVSGLISNWYRKDKRFNGNTTYQPKNPGSRAGQGDAQLKALRGLKRKFAGTEKESIIDAQINERLEAIQTERAKKIEVDLSVLPEGLAEELGLGE